MKENLSSIENKLSQGSGIIVTDNYSHIYQTDRVLLSREPYTKCNWTVNAIQVLNPTPLQQDLTIPQYSDGSLLATIPTSLKKLIPVCNRVRYVSLFRT